MVTDLIVGRKRIWVTAYNPSDALARLYCVYVVARIKELLAKVDEEDVHAWLRENIPGSADYLDWIEQGGRPTPEAGEHEFPLTPGAEEIELQIVSYLHRAG